jgi:hypothetical protein
MKKYFLYELKKNLNPLLFFTAICTILYVTVIATSRLCYVEANDSGEKIGINCSTNIWVVYSLLGLLCAIVPVLMYSFKMKKRSVDAFYSLPIKREKIMLVKTMVGLLLVLIPYTIAYWAGFLTVCCRENYFRLGYYVPGYFGGILFGVCLYGVYAFSFTRANSVSDGIVFMLAYTFIGGLLTGSVALNVDAVSLTGAFESYDFIIFGGLDVFGGNMNNLIRGESVTWRAITFVVPIVYAVLSYTLLFVLVKKEKGEDAEQISLSRFGYRALIPLYIVAFMSMNRNGSILNFILILIGAVVATVAYTRKIRFGRKYWAMIGISLVVGFCVGLLFYGLNIMIR